MKTIIITGASSGIGRALAQHLDPSKYAIVLASRSADKLASIAADLKEHKLLTVSTDVRDYESCKALVAKAEEAFGPVDILVNNAGLGYFDPLVQGKIEQWHEMIDTNVKGVVNCLHAALPSLVKQGGHVINLGSIASHHVFPESGVYCATKHALFGISESIRVELGGQVKVTTISPGAVDTDFINKTTNEEIHDKLKDYFSSGIHASTIAEQIIHALEAPGNTAINEIILRPFR